MTNDTAFTHLQWEIMENARASYFYAKQQSRIMFCYHQIAYICIIICNIYGKRQHDVNPVSYFYQLRTAPISECNDDILKNVCFWSKVTYQIKRTEESIYLGTLAPKAGISGCQIKDIMYAIKTGTDLLKLHPPDANEPRLWMLGINDHFEDYMKNVHTSRLYSNIICFLKTENGTREYTKLIEIKVLDTNSPVPQEKNMKILINGSRIAKEQVIEGIFFLDQHPTNRYSYEAFIDDKNMSHFLEPSCTFHTDSRDGKNATAIHCSLIVTKSRTFKEDVNFLLGLKRNNLSNSEKNNIGYINITLCIGNNPKKRSSSSDHYYYKRDNKIFRTAAPYARVTQPNKRLKNVKNYHVEVINFNITPFEITNEGIIYVYNFMDLRKSEEHLSLYVTWSQDNISHFEEVRVRVVDEPTKTCLLMENLDDWAFCSQFKNSKSCLRNDSCALGTGGATSIENRAGPNRCMWHGDKHPESHETHMYSTCSADTKYCPDGTCDSLEELREDELCPQDCSKNAAFPTKLNPLTGRGIDKCNGVLVCDMVCFCNIKIHNENNETLVAQMKKNKLIVEKKCDLKCIMATTGGIVVFVSIIFFIALFWRMNYVKTLTQKKSIGNMQEAETPFSEYIDRNVINEPLTLNFHMTTALDYTNPNLTTLKTNEIDSKWEFPRSQICIEQILGEGEFGKVLKAKAFNIGGRPGYSLVAVKTLKDDARKQDFVDLFSEYQLLKQVCHPHVIQLLGVCSSKEGPLYIIIEYAKFGSLRNYLRRSRHILTNTELANLEENQIHKVTPRDILSFARQISSGMSYLSDFKLVHRDLAARNILLAENKICKVSDFGLTRDIYEDNAYFKKSKGRVPVKWMAPESLADHVYTTKSDVWSFGILIWELVTLGASPYPGIPVHNLYNLLKEGYRMEKPANSSTVLYSLMKRCWHIDPEERPTFLELYHCFDTLLTDNVNYLDLSDNAIINKSYFSMEAERESPSENINLLENYPFYKEFVQNKDTSCIVEEEHKEVNICLGYETPVKNPRRVTTPTNEMPEEYTDMNFKEDM